MINDIILLVAERADLPTLARLMLLCKTSYALIKKYQHSIVKGHLGIRLRGPLYPSEYAPCGRVLSQAKILEAYTFDMLQELDCRERSIEGLFSPGQPLHQPLLQNYPGFTDQADPSLQRLVFGLSRACMVLDRLSDCVADVCSNLTPAAVQLARAAPMDPFPLVLRRVRRAQMAVLRSLGLADLAFLAKLTVLCGEAWAQSRANRPGHSESQVLRRASEEVVLRHGTRAIRSLMRPDSFASYAATQSLIQARAWENASVHARDLEIYEKDDNFVNDESIGPILPSLRLILWDALRKKAGECLGADYEDYEDVENVMNLVVLGEIGEVCLPRPGH